MRSGRRTPRTFASLSIIATLALTACGDEGGGTAASGEAPSAIAPAEAPLYIETLVRPEGETAETLARLVTAATGEPDPIGGAIEKFDAAAAQDGVDFSYEEDIEPWLGEHGAVVFNDAQALIESGGEIPTASTSGETDTDQPPENYVLIIETTGEDAAREALDKFVELGAEEDPSAEISDASYEGTDYVQIESDEASVALGLVDGFLVFGDQAGFEAAVDTALGAESLAGDAEFTGGIEQLADEPSFALYADTPSLIDAAEQAGAFSPEDRAALDFYRGYLEQPIFATLAVDSAAIDLGFSTGSAGYPMAEEGLLDGLPADAWLAFGVPALGEYFALFVDQLQAADAEFRREFETGSAEIERALGMPLDEVFGSLGELTGYVRGDSPLAIDGALSLSTSDPDAAVGLLGKAGEQAAREGEQLTPIEGIEGLEDASGFQVQPEGAPMAVLAFVSGEQVVVSYGEQAGIDAAAPAETLGDSESYSQAVDELADVEPSVYLDVEPVAELLGNVPVSTEEVDVERVISVLGELDYVIAGAATDDGRDVTRYRFGLDE
ncbi:MAG: DUF3352 domain-containing protein [Solirubrobacterales bacterium]|nr:DUF3352 domain-containing protein [Solirubrobacterales bacterium]